MESSSRSSASSGAPAVSDPAEEVAGAGAALDLTAEPEARPAASPRPFQAEPYDPSRDQEGVRANVSYILLGLIIGFVVLAFLGVLAKWLDIDTVTKLAAVLFSPIIGLFGAVMGFYFGEKQGRRSGGGSG